MSDFFKKSGEEKNFGLFPNATETASFPRVDVFGRSEGTNVFGRNEGMNAIDYANTYGKKDATKKKEQELFSGEKDEIIEEVRKGIAENEEQEGSAERSKEDISYYVGEITNLFLDMPLNIEITDGPYSEQVRIINLEIGTKEKITIEGFKEVLNETLAGIREDGHYQKYDMYTEYPSSGKSILDFFKKKEENHDTYTKRDEEQLKQFWDEIKLSIAYKLMTDGKGDEDLKENCSFVKLVSEGEENTLIIESY